MESHSRVGSPLRQSCSYACCETSVTRSPSLIEAHDPDEIGSGLQGSYRMGMGKPFAGFESRSSLRRKPWVNRVGCSVLCVYAHRRVPSLHFNKRRNEESWLRYAEFM